MQHQTELFTQFINDFRQEHNSLSKMIQDTNISNLKPDQLNQIIIFLQKANLNFTQYSLFESALYCAKIEKSCRTLMDNKQDDEHSFDFFRNNFDQLPNIITGDFIDHNLQASKGSLNQSNPPLVYVVDDEPMLLELFEAMLQTLPIRIKTFNNPEKAVEDFLFDRPALILSDMKMPEMTGSDLLKKIRLMDQAVSFIFISGYINKDNVLEFMNLGVYGVIEKPFKAPQVLSLVEKSLKNFEIKSTYNLTLEKIILKTFSSGSDQMKNLIEVLLENKKNFFQYS